MTTDIAVRGHDYGGRIEDYEEYDENSSARLFERSRIKALAGTFFRYCHRSSSQMPLGLRASHRPSDTLIYRAPRSTAHNRP